MSDGSQEGQAPRLPPMPPIPKSGRLAGVDFGTVRIGIAISDPSQSIASPLETYNRRNEALDAQYFQQLAKTEELAGLVVGLPVHMSGDASAKSVQAVKFGVWIFEQTQTPVAWVDERYTTARAREMLNQANLSGKKRKSMLDKIAAHVILSAYIESSRHDATSLDDQ